LRGGARIEVAGRGEARKVPRALNRAGPKLGEVVGDVIDHLLINGCRARVTAAADAIPGELAKL
jgi:hypothetical protein